MVLIQPTNTLDEANMSYSLDRSKRKLPRTEWDGSNSGTGSRNMSYANGGTGGRSSRRSKESGRSSRRSTGSRGSRGSNREHSWQNRNKPRPDDAPTLPRRTIRGVPPPGARKAKKKRSNRGWLCGLILGVILAIGALGCTAASFSTDYWVITEVNRTALISNPRLISQIKTTNYRSNNRGLFKTCYENYQAQSLDKTDGTQQCFGELRYEINRRTLTQNWGNDYDLYVHLMRLTFISLILGMVLQLVMIMGGIVVAMRDSRKLLAVVVSVTFFAVLFVGGGMGTFHAVDYYENNKIKQDEFPADWPDSHPELSKNYTRMYGWSYVMCWVGVALTLFTLLLYVITYINLSRHKAKYPRVVDPPYSTHTYKTASTHLSSRKSDGEANSYYATSSKASRNYAYDMAEFDLPPPDELDCLEEDMFSESTKM